MEEQNMENNEQNQHKKTFTQEEVNRIVQERLARAKASQERETDQEETKEDKELEGRETSIALRENRVECREFIAEKGYKKELLDILDTSDAEKFRSQAEKLVALYGEAEEKKHYPGTKPNTSIRKDQRTSSFPNTKHIPKQY